MWNHSYRVCEFRDHTEIYQLQTIINNLNQHWFCVSNLRSTVVCIQQSNTDPQKLFFTDSEADGFLDLTLNITVAQPVKHFHV